jgi:hypothetical protein
MRYAETATRHELVARRAAGAAALRTPPRGGMVDAVVGGDGSHLRSWQDTLDLPPTKSWLRSWREAFGRPG